MGRGIPLWEREVQKIRSYNAEISMVEISKFFTPRRQLALQAIKKYDKVDFYFQKTHTFSKGILKKVTLSRLRRLSVRRQIFSFNIFNFVEKSDL